MICCSVFNSKKLFIIFLLTSLSLSPLYAIVLKIGLTYNGSGYQNNLASLSTLYVWSTGKFEIYDEATNDVVFEGTGGRKLDISGTRVTINSIGTYNGPLIVRTYQYDSDILVKISPDNTNWDSYRGYLRLWSDGTYFEIINHVELEYYLYGVVPSEIGYNSPVEAQKAQAVTARTFAVAGLKKHGNYDLCNLTHCQVYKGYDIEHSLSNTSVDQTAGVSMKYNGQSLKSIFYFSSCGGVTANNEDIWGGTATGYLRSIQDKGTSGNYYCYGSNDFNWTLTLSNSELQTKLKNYSGTAPANTSSVLGSNGIRIANTDSSGRANTIQITYTNPSQTKDVTGTTFRMALGTTELKSTFITDISYNSVDKSYKFTGRGFGHGVGMCQDGAIGMASSPNNKTYDVILKHYFTGIVISDSEGPIISHVPISTASYNTALTVACKVTDASTISTVKLYYRNNSVPWANTTMSYIGNNNYSAQIPAAVLTSNSVSYYFYAEDNGQNGTYLPSNYDIAPYSIAVGPSDTVPPVISHTAVRSSLPYNSIPISAKVTDATGIQSVILYFKRDNNNIYTSQLMTTVSNNNYTTQIASNDVSGNIDYYIQARDSSSLHNTSYSGTATTPYKIVVSSSDILSPLITHVTPGSKKENEIITLTAIITDDSGINSVTLYYRKVGVTQYTSKYMQTTDWVNFSVSIPSEMSKPPGVEYYIVAEDKSSLHNVAYAGTAASPYRINITSNGNGTNTSTSTVVTNDYKTVYTPAGSTGNYGIKIGFPVSSSNSVPIVKIYDLKGRIVKVLDDVNVVIDGTTGTVDWDGRGNNNEIVASGIYFYRLELDNEIRTGRIIIAK